MPYATSYTTATTQAFVQRIQMSLISTAISVINEATSTPLHPNRAALASKILQNPSGWAALFAVGAASDNLTDNTATDAALDSRIAAIYNGYL